MTALTGGHRDAGSTNRRWTLRLRGLAPHLFLLPAAFVVASPFLWMLATSVKPPDEIFSEPLSLWPKTFAGIENYGFALTHVPMLRFMLNGVVVVAGILTVQVVVAVFCAYALAKLEFRGRQLLFTLVIVGLCVPMQVVALPLFLALAGLRLIDSYFALMVPFFLSVAIFLLRQAFKAFPDQVIEAARLDGFSEFKIVVRLILPGAKATIAAFAVFSITAHWNDLYWPLIVTTTLDRAMPPLGMLLFNEGELGANYGALAAGATIITVPLLIAFLFAQRQFIRGISISGFR